MTRLAVLATALVLLVPAFSTAGPLDGLDVSSLLGGDDSSSSSTNNNTATTAATTTTADQSVAPGAGTTPGYGGYANGSTAIANLPQKLGNADAGLASGEINSGGGIVDDWSGTERDESKDTSAGVVEAVGVQNLLGTINQSLGSAGSTGSGAYGSGITGGMDVIDLPGIASIDLGSYKTKSDNNSTESEITVLHVKVEALNLDLNIPIGNSSGSTKKDGSQITSRSTSDLISSAPGKPLVIGPGLLGDKGLLSLLLLSAESESSADGTKAENQNDWTVADLGLLGLDLLTVDKATGLNIAGLNLLKAPAGANGAMLPLDLGLVGIFIGEEWSKTDGKNWAYGGTNGLRIKLLDQESFLVLGHAGSGANAVSSDGPGAGPNQENEGPQGSNKAPGSIGEPNDKPIGDADTKLCPEGQSLVGDQCVVVPTCPEGEELVDGKCQPIPPDCPVGQQLVNGTCQSLVPDQPSADPTNPLTPISDLFGSLGGRGSLPITGMPFTYLLVGLNAAGITALGLQRLRRRK